MANAGRLDFYENFTSLWALKINLGNFKGRAR
jgi:hypothetical protein